MTPALEDLVFEVHPEVTFWVMNGERPIEQSKRRPEGRRARLALLQNYCSEIETLVFARKSLAGDLIDATAAAWTAARIARGESRAVISNPPRDSKGLRMNIFY